MGAVYKILILYSLLIAAILLGAFFVQRMNGVMYHHEFYARLVLPPQEMERYRDVISAESRPDTLIERYTLSFENNVSLRWLEVLIAGIILSLPVMIARQFPTLKALSIGLMNALLLIGLGWSAHQMHWLGFSANPVDTLIALTLYLLLGGIVFLETSFLYLSFRERVRNMTGQSVL